MPRLALDLRFWVGRSLHSRLTFGLPPVEMTPFGVMDLWSIRTILDDLLSGV